VPLVIYKGQGYLLLLLEISLLIIKIYLNFLSEYKGAMMTDTVRICLNSNGYTSPSGGYKAYSPANRNANSHARGIGMEEWIGGTQFDVSSADLKALQPSFCDLEDEITYRVGLIEAYRCVN